MVTRIFPIKTLLIISPGEITDYTSGMTEYYNKTKKQQREEKRAEKKIKKVLREA